VRTLIDKSLPPGRYKATLNVRGVAVATGLYLCEATSEGTRLTQKMSLLK
jgi:hypothetical protein